MRAKQKYFLLDRPLVAVQDREGNDHNGQPQCDTANADSGNGSGKTALRSVTHPAGQK